MSWTFIILVFITCAIAVGFVARPLFGTGNTKSTLTLAVGLPVFCIGVYLFLGSPGMQNVATAEHSGARPSQTQTPQIANSSVDKVGSVASMVLGLESRLAETPDDAKGWLLLSRSYQHVGRTGDAIDAYESAAALGEYDAALAELVRPGSVQANLFDSSAVIIGSVDVSDRAASIIEPTDTIFVFARASGAAGVPAAVLRQSASDFPVQFKLDDSMAMVDGVRLSDFKNVDITTRISRSGSATEALQGLEAKVRDIAVASGAEIHLMIE